MEKDDASVYIKNERLKKEFEKLQLPLDGIFNYVPYNLELENRRLESLLFFTHKYLEYGSQETMEKLNYLFPPVFPAISPENDWLRFKKWINGEQVIQKFKDRLPKDYNIILASELSDDEIVIELNKIKKILAETGYYIGLRDDVPSRLVYEMVLETLEEEDMGGGGWHNDGCSGYCPGCIQRPWCDTGQEHCWTEDEEAGKMYLPEELKDFVSASPISLSLLEESQKKHDEAMEKFNPVSYTHLTLPTICSV